MPGIPKPHDRLIPFTVMGVLLGTGWWLLDAAAAAYLFRQGSFIDMAVFPVSSVVVMRSVILLVFIASGIILDLYIHRISKNERIYHKLLDAAPDGLVIVNGRGKITMVNQQLEAMTGYRRRELVGEDMEKLMPDGFDIGGQTMQNYFTHRQHLSINNLEVDITCRDGGVFPAEIRLSPMQTEEGSIISVDVRDISERKATDQALISSEARLRRYFDAGLIGMAIVSPEMKLIQCNDKYCEITGYARDELLAMKFTDITHPDDLDTAIEQFQSAMRGEIDGFELSKRYVRKDGRVVDVVISTKFVYAADGSMSYSVDFIQDVTVQKRVEKELREREKRLREAQRIARLGFWEWDLVRDKLIWSEDLFSMLGLDPDEFEVNPDSLLELIHPDDRTDFNEHLHAVLEHDIPFKHEHRIILPNGDLRFHRVQGELIRETSGLPVRMFGTVLDITEQKLAERTLLLYEHIVNASTDALAIVDTEYRYLAVNQHYLDAFQTTRDKVIGKQVKEIIGEDNFNNFARPNIDKAITTGTTSNMQGWSYQQGFGKRYLDIYDTALKDADGRVFGVVINAHDITERKLAEDELQRNEELLRRYYEAGSVGMALSSPDKGFFQFNDTFCDIVGYPREVITNISWQDITHPEDLVQDRQEFNRVLNREIDGYTLDMRVIRADGGIAYITAAVSCARKPDGSMDYLVTFVHDITERKQAEQALKKSEERFAKAFESTPNAVGISRLRDGLVLFANAGFTNLYGYTPEEWLGKTTLELGIWRNLDQRTILMDKIKDGEVKGYETEVVTKGGNIVPVSISASVIEMDDESCIVVWVQDLREVKKAEQERRKLEQQLFRSQKMEAIGQLTGGIAHDFNNILASILGYTNLAIRRCANLDEPKLADYLKEVVHGSERARDLIQQMMMYSRSVPSVATSQSLQPLVENAIKLLRPMLPSNIDIQSQLPVDIPEVMIDPAQFEQIIMNLCINARDAIDGAGSIELELYRAGISSMECASCHSMLSGDYVVLSVKDTGCGIDEKIAPLIFDPFYTTKEVGHGTGMGLSMIHGIMHNSSGHILLGSEPDRGATFSLLFPVADGAWKNNKVHRQKLPQVLHGPRQQGLIMVVDDEPSIANYLGELLESHGYQVLIMTSSEKALNTFKGRINDIDLVITDQTMPGTTGVELAQELLLLRPDVPIILSSGYSEMLNQEIISRAGIRAYFTKPLDEPLLMAKLNELITRKVVKVETAVRH